MRWSMPLGALGWDGETVGGGFNILGPVSFRTLSPNPLPPIPRGEWLIGLWCRAADVFVQDAGDEALIGQAFFGGAPFQHFQVHCRFGRPFAYSGGRLP